MKFNSILRRKAPLRNHEGEKAYRLSSELELYSAVVTTSLEKVNYEEGNIRLERIQDLVGKCHPVFVAKLAVYARQVMNLRSIPIVLAVELGKIHRGDDLVSRAVYQVIQRADEISEILAYYQMANSRNGVKKLNRLSKQVQKGIAKAFLKFDEYQFAKYDRKTEVSLKDALFLTHPKPESDEQQALFNKIVNGELQAPFTWEVELSELGQNKFASESDKTLAFRKKWEELIDSQRLGYMATLRNLRNILEAEVSSEHIQKVADYLANEKAVKYSRQLPFRFLSAYREVQPLKSSYATFILAALEKAVKMSARNIHGFGLNTRVVIACDVSGSMNQPISPKSKVALYDVGLMLGMLLQSRCANSITGIFGNTWLQYTLPGDGILQNTRELQRIEGKVGYATNGYKVIEALNTKNEQVDKVMIFTDLQIWNNNRDGKHIQKEWIKYKRETAPNAKLYLFDLAGYGQTPLQVKENDVFLIAGWSDKVFDVLNALEESQKALSEISKVEL